MANFVFGNTEMRIISNIIFDLGGVIMNINYQRAINALKEIGINNFDKLYTQFGQTKLFDNYDKGFISPAEFRDEVRKISQTDFSDEAFNSAWNLMLVDIPKENIQLLKTLKNHFNIYLLSNTNEIHLEFLSGYLPGTYNIKNLDSLFHKTYYSCRIHMRKPDREIYLHVLQDNKIQASKTLFIDDFQPNVDAAIELGIRGYFLQKEGSLIELFKNYI